MLWTMKTCEYRPTQQLWAVNASILCFTTDFHAVLMWCFCESTIVCPPCFMFGDSSSWRLEESLCSNTMISCQGKHISMYMLFPMHYPSEVTYPKPTKRNFSRSWTETLYSPTYFISNHNNYSVLCIRPLNTSIEVLSISFIDTLPCYQGNSLSQY